MFKPSGPPPNQHGNLCKLSKSCQKLPECLPVFVLNKSIYFRNTKQVFCIQIQFKSQRVDKSQEMYRSMYSTLLQTSSTSSRGNEKSSITWITQLETLQISRAALKKAVTCLCLLSLTQGLIGHLCLYTDSEGEI